MQEAAERSGKTQPGGGKSFARRLWHLLWMLVAVFLVIIVLALINNNFSLRSPSRAEFRAQVDHGIETSTKWLMGHPEIQNNPSTMFMIADMEKMSGDPRLRTMLDQYMHSRYVRDPFDPMSYVWARLVDPKAEVPMVRVSLPPGQDWNEPAWDAYAVAPDRVVLPDNLRASMFSPTQYTWGKRQHQLLALDMYRYYNGGSEELNNTINYLAEKIARDAHYDVRVNDSYIQRSAFMFASNRPDLVRSRWIDRILDYQRADGSWADCWYGWCRGILEFRLEDRPAHTTIQGAWTLYMLKYRFSPWIDQHYH